MLNKLIFKLILSFIIKIHNLFLYHLEHIFNMFEGILATILNKYLSEYIDEVDYNNLKLGLFSGTLELSNIKIKKSALVS